MVLVKFKDISICFLVAVFIILTMSITTAQNTSVQHLDFEVEDQSFNSASYVLLANETFNRSTVSSLIVYGGAQVNKQIGASSTIVSMKIDANGVTYFDKPVRTIVGSSDRGVFTIPSFNFTAIDGENSIQVYMKEFGSGAIDVGSLEIHTNTDVTNDNHTISFSITNESISFSNLSFQNVGSYVLNKNNHSKTYLDLHHTIESNTVGGDVLSCYLVNNKSSERTPTYSRYSILGTSVGSTGVNYKSSISTNGSEQWDLFCKNSLSTTTGNNVTVYLLELADDVDSQIQGFQNSSSGSQLVTGLESIATIRDYNVSEGGQVEVAVTIISSSLSDAQTGSSSPRFEFNSTDLPLANCSEEYSRSLTNNSDVGTTKFYVNCNNLTVGQLYDFDLYADVLTGETINVSMVSISAFETTIQNITAQNVPPLISILFPDNNTVFIDENDSTINWTSSDPNGDTFGINISLHNGTETFIGQGLDPDLNNISVNYRNYANGEYTLEVEACETDTPELLCSRENITITIYNVCLPYDGESVGADWSYEGKVLKGNTFFDSTDYMIIQNNSHMINLSNNFSIAWWMKEEDYTNPDVFDIIITSWSGAYETSQFGFWKNNLDDSYRITYFSANDGQTVHTILNKGITPNVWHHMVITFSDGDTELYIDSVQNFTGNLSLDTSIDSTLGKPILMGGGATSRYWNGTLDEVIFFDKKISQTEVNQIYNSSKAEKKFVDDDSIRVYEMDMFGNCFNQSGVTDLVDYYNCYAIPFEGSDITDVRGLL